MAAQLSMQAVGILSVWLETLLYGMYASLFFETVFIIIKKNKTNTGPSKIFFGAIILMFLTATTHIAVNLHRVMQAYVYQVDTIGPVAYFGDLGRWDNILQDSLNAFMTWVGDGLVIYRCYIVWQEKLPVVLVPIAMVIMSIIANSIALYRFAHLGQVTIFAPSLVHWMNTIYALAFVQNTLTTGLIAYRIYAQDRLSRGLVASSQVGLVELIRIMVESAGVYVLNVLILIILYAVNSNGQYIAQDAIVPVCGIVFTLITVRLAMATAPTLQTTRRDQTTIQFGARATGTTHTHTTSATDQSARAEWAEDASGKYGLPLEDMFADAQDGGEKRGMEMLETHEV
ncbi:hypothetical protein HWV62_29248 [Athelia sp. TMB]|nr:hypothetical protein HWV62_29248 [Athelia sp. TMB]